MIKYEIERLPELRARFDPRLVNKAMFHALDVSIRKLRVRVSREIRKTYNVKAAAISKSLFIRKDTINGRLLTYTGFAIPLDKFDPKPKIIRAKRRKIRGIGVTVKIRKDRGRKLVQGGFMANVNGQKIFKRVGESRLPIRRLLGPSIAHMAAEETVVKMSLLQVGEDLGFEFSRYLDVLLTKSAKM